MAKVKEIKKIESKIKEVKLDKKKEDKGSLENDSKKKEDFGEVNLETANGRRFSTLLEEDNSAQQIVPQNLEKSLEDVSVPKKEEEKKDEALYTKAKKNYEDREGPTTEPWLNARRLEVLRNEMPSFSTTAIPQPGFSQLTPIRQELQSSGENQYQKPELLRENHQQKANPFEREERKYVA